MPRRFPVLWCTAALIPAGCAAPGGADQDGSRGGTVTLTRVDLEAGTPAASVDGAAVFFAPPGPAPDDHWPDDGQCAWGLPEETEDAPIAWLDAGSQITLAGGTATLPFDRFTVEGDRIVYLSSAGADPAGFVPEGRYRLEIPGSAAANGLPANTVEDAVVMPPAIGLYAPDMTAGPATIGAMPLQIGWGPAPGSGRVLVTIEISGASESAVLRCATPDTGVFELGLDRLGELPAGSGRLTVTREHVRFSPLTASTELVGLGRVVEGGGVVVAH